MSEFKTSFILSKCELQFLLYNRPDVIPSAASQYLLKQYLTNGEITQDAIEGLAYKNLIRVSDGTVFFEPVVNVLAKAALSADTIWIAKRKKDIKLVFILRTRELCLFSELYPRIPDSWKIVPYQTLEALKNDIDMRSVGEIIEVTNTGTPRVLSDDEVQSWQRGE